MKSMKELKHFLKVSQELIEEYIEDRAKDIDSDRIYPGCRARDYAIEEIELDNPCDDLYFHLTENKEFVKAFRALLEAL